jgi:hypothetical protein
VTLSPTRRPRSRAPMIAVGAAVLALAGVGGWIGLSKKSDATTTPAAGPPQPQAEAPKAVTPPPAGDEVTIIVASDPPGARVQRADKSDPEKQPTPITFKMHRGDPPFDIQLRLEGYLPQTRTITSDESVKVLVSLAKLPTVAPKAEAKVEAPAKTPEAKVSNVTRPTSHSSSHHSTPKSSAPKNSEPDPDGIIPPNFGN